MLKPCCAYSCTQYCLHTQYMLLTHADDLLCLQLPTVGSPYTILASNRCWSLVVPTAAHSTVSIHHTCLWPMLKPCCAYSCTQYSLHTQYMLLTHADDLLCLQLHTVWPWFFSMPLRFPTWLTLVAVRGLSQWHVDWTCSMACNEVSWKVATKKIKRGEKIIQIVIVVKQIMVTWPDWLIDWLLYIWVRDLMVLMHLGLNWQALCAPYQFNGALVLCWSSRSPPDLHS